jgi:amidase
MTNANQLSATEAALRLADRSLSAETLLRDCLAQIDAREPEILAWQHLARDAALARAQALDRGAHSGMLHGLPIGVKDLIATADMPTGYGSAIYAGHQPANDASCVALARAAGAVILGKTVTTELATVQPNGTRNPHRPSRGADAGVVHSPGGSSQGSAAAVAAHMVPLALGTQTAGSLIRPASYCGVVAYKPTFGLISRIGAKPVSDSLDTLGTLARTVPDAALLAAALSGRHNLLVKPLADTLSRPLRVGLCRTFEWAQADADSQAVLTKAFAQLQASSQNFTASWLDLPADFAHLVQAQTHIQLVEQAQSFAFERLHHHALLSPRLQAIMAAGLQVTVDQYDAAVAWVARCRGQLTDIFSQVDVLLCPSATGAAPAGLDQTGDPVFGRHWTALQTPSVNIAVGAAANGMPVGLQVVGPVWGDALTLAAAHGLHEALGG